MLATVCSQAATLSSGSIVEEILSSYHSGARKVSLQAGTFTVSNSGTGTPIVLSGLSNFEIDGAGAILIFSESRHGALRFENCRQVSLHNLTVQFDPPPFTQGIIRSIGEDKSSYQLQVDGGYPDLADGTIFPSTPYGELFEGKSQKLKRGGGGMTPLRILKTGADQYTVDLPHATASMGVAEIGDRVVFRGNLGSPAITVTESQGVTLSDITVHSAAAAGIVETGGGGANRYQGLRVQPGPAPSGASEAPLVSATSDGFHSSGVRKGPTVEASHFEAMLDDAIAIHGRYSFVLKRDGADLVVAGGNFQAGDTVVLTDRDQRPVSTARVTSVSLEQHFESSRKSERKTVVDLTRGPHYRLTLDHPVDAEFDDLLANDSATGSGFTVRGNVILNHRARGILLKASEGLVEDNVIDGSSIGGIVVSPEFEWAEAGFSRNLAIRRNKISNVGYSSYSMGAIAIGAWDADHGRPVAAQGQSGITVEDNSISNIEGPSIAITSARNVVVRGNQFSAIQSRKPWTTSGWRMDSGAVIWLAECRDVRFENNRIDQLGPFARVLVENATTGKSFARIKGIEIKSRVKGVN